MNLCGNGYIPDTEVVNGKYTVKQGEYVARIGDVYYESLNEAIAACPTETYDDNAVTTLSPTTIELLCDAEGGFDVGVEANKYDTQNIILNLNGYTLTLGHPGVASGPEDNKGIRVLAHSKLVINNGTLDVSAANVTKGMNVYGECTLNDVEFIVGGTMDYTVRNRGVLTLSGETIIPNCGDAPALVVEPYEYGAIYSDPMTFDVDATVICDSADVVVGDIVVKLAEMEHHSTGEVNNGVPNLDISAGTFGTITEEDDDKVPEGNITGGNFAAQVPGQYCAPGYIPVTTADSVTGLYTVEQKDVAYSVNLTVQDSIGVNLYIKNIATPEEASRYTIRAVLYDGVESKEVVHTLTAADYYNVKEEFVYRYRVADVFAYQMGDNIEIEVYYDGLIVKHVESYSVYQYLHNTIENYKNNSQYDKLVDFCYAALNYGAEAQMYFRRGLTYKDENGVQHLYPNDYNVITPVNAEYVSEHPIAANRPDDAYAASRSGSIEDITAYSLSLVLGSETSIKVYLTGDVSDVTVSCTDSRGVERNVTAIRADGNRHSFKITGIKCFELYRTYTITITRGGDTVTLIYSPYTYARNNWNSASIGNLVQAMVDYGNKAQANWPDTAN